MNWHLYTSLEGRISRKTYWLWFFVPIGVTRVLANVVDLSLGYDLPNEFGPVSGIQFLLTLWPGVAGWVKRLHDRGITGKYVAGFFGLSVPAMALLVMGMRSESGGLIAVALIPWFAYLMCLFIATGFLRGTQGPNRYGTDPLEESLNNNPLGPSPAGPQA